MATTPPRALAEELERYAALGLSPVLFASEARMLLENLTLQPQEEEARRELLEELRQVPLGSKVSLLQVAHRARRLTPGRTP